MISSRYAGPLSRGREEAASGKSSRCAGLLDLGREEAALGELRLRGAASLSEGGGCFCGVLPLRGAAR